MIPMLYLAPVDWASIRQRPQQLALRLAARFRLCYVNPVGLRSIRLGDIGRIIERARPAGHPPFQVLSPWYLPFVGLPGMDRANRRWLLGQTAASFPLDRQPWILWLSTPSLLAQALVERAKPSLVVYDCMDRYAAFHRGRDRRRIEAAERWVVERADVILASSRALADSPPLGGRSALVIANGVEPTAFALANRPQPPRWRTSFSGPAIGYHGTLGDWLDFDLLAELAIARPGWKFVFVGPCPTRRGKEFFSLANVLRVGPVDYADLPAHTAHFDVGIVPFVNNELTRHVYPIKALEYLAAGLPTVSSPLAELAELSRLVRFARTSGEWLAELDSALAPASNRPEQVAARRAAARERCWDAAAARIVDALASAMRTPARHCHAA